MRPLNKKTIIFLILAVSLFLGSLGAQAVLAETKYAPLPYYKLEIPLGATTVIKDVADYIVIIYKFSLGISAILATILIMFGAMKWITAAGSESAITGARETITSALIGLIIALGSFVLLNTINPNLTTMSAAVTEIQFYCPGGELSKSLGQQCAEDCECKSEFTDMNGVTLAATCQNNICTSNLSPGDLCAWEKVEYRLKTAIESNDIASHCQFGCRGGTISDLNIVDEDGDGDNDVATMQWFCADSVTTVFENCVYGGASGSYWDPYNDRCLDKDLFYCLLTYDGDFSQCSS